MFCTKRINMEIQVKVRKCLEKATLTNKTKTNDNILTEGVYHINDESGRKIMSVTCQVCNVTQIYYN